MSKRVFDTEISGFGSFRVQVTEELLDRRRRLDAD